MNNDEQDMQPQASQAEDNENVNAASDAVEGTNENEAGVETDTTSQASADSADTVTADDAGDAGTGDAVDAVATDDAMSETAADDTADTASASEAADSPAEIIASEDRDNQDAEMPGEVETPGEDEAAPQIAQASETSQAEGEPESVEAVVEPDMQDDAVDAVDAVAVDGAGMGVEESAVEDTPAVAVDETPAAVETDNTDSGVETSPASADERATEVAETGADVAPSALAEDLADTEDSTEVAEDAGYEEPVVRSNRLQDVSPNASMEDLLRASEQQYRTLKHGDVVEGTVMKVGRDEILVDIGAKTEGIVPSAELQSLTPEEREALAIGDPLLVSVVQPENNEGHAVLSLDRARQEKSWRDLQKRFEGGEIIQARVTGYNKGGLLVNLEGVRGFVPSSQISSLTGGPEAQKQSEMAKLQNQTIPMKIIEINRSRNRLILSERQAMQEQRESVRSRLLRELEPGQVRLGRVSSICDFGAFVDIGGADGLIHLSEISWKRVAHPSDVLKVGDQVNVYVLSVDPNERKIALSLKRTQPEPWSTITENYRLGQIVHGTITQLTTFGAFARLEDGIEGLIHVSELAEGRVAHPKNVVNVGDSLDLKVIRIDPAKRRIGLSLKRVNEDENAPVPTGEEGDEMAPSAAPTMGASGEMDVAPIGQAEMTEVASTAIEMEQAGSDTGTQEGTPQPEMQATERAERPERPERQDRGGRDRGRDRNQGNQGRQQQSAPSGGDSEEPMGALAQALGAFMNRDADEEEEES